MIGYVRTLVHDAEQGDRPRNVLFELTVGALLTMLGFRVQVTRCDEDILAHHDALPAPLVVECKHPALCHDEERAERRVLSNLKELRHQLRKRNPRNIRMGVLGMAGVYGASSSRMILRAADGRALERKVEAALQGDITAIRRLNLQRNLRLESSMRVCAVAFVGAGLSDDGTAFALQRMRAFTMGDDRRLTRAMLKAFPRDM